MQQQQIVRELLQNHKPADDSEKHSLERIIKLLDTADSPFFRDHFLPGHLTASGIVLNPARTKTLLIFHNKLQRWLQPGGHFEPGEFDPSAAAAREVLEETGVPTRWPGERPVLLDVDVHHIPPHKRNPPHYHFDLRMLLIADDNQKMLKPQEVRDVRWAMPAEFERFDLDPGTVRALKKCMAGVTI